MKHLSIEDLKKFENISILSKFVSNTINKELLIVSTVTRDNNTIHSEFVVKNNGITVFSSFQLVKAIQEYNKID